MQGINCKNYLCKIEPGIFFTQVYFTFHLLEELAPWEEVQHHIQIMLILQRLMNITAEVFLLELV